MVFLPRWDRFSERPNFDSYELDYNNDFVRDSGEIWEFLEGTGNLLGLKTAAPVIASLTTSASWKDNIFYNDGSNGAAHGRLDLETTLQSLQYSSGTLVVRFKSDMPAGTKACLFQLGNAAGDFFDNTLLYIGSQTSAYTDETVGLYINTGNSYAVQIFARLGSDYFNDGKVHEVAYVIDGQDNRVYVDGIRRTATFKQGSPTTSGYFLNYSNSNRVYLGHRYYVGQYGTMRYTGDYRGVAIYPTYWTDDTAANHWENPYQILKPRRKYWLFNASSTPSSDLILPDSRFEMPSLYYPGRKPVGNVKIDYNSPISRIMKPGKAMVVGPFSNKFDLLNNYQKTITGTTTIENLKILGTVNTNDGVTFNPTDFSFHGASSLSIISVIEFSPGNFAGTLTTTNEFLRQTTSNASAKGVSFAGVGARQKIRALIQTTGTSIWTTAQDQDITEYKKGLALIAMVWDGNKRYIYAGNIGNKTTQIRSNTCTGTCNIFNNSTSKTVIFGGLHNNSKGPDEPAHLTILSKIAATKTELDALCKNPYQFLA